MPERWQRELRKLDAEPMPDRVRDRMQEGPRGDGMPSARHRVIAAAVAFAVFFAAGSFAWLAFRPTGGRIVGGDAEEPTYTEAVVTFHESGVEVGGGDPSIPAAEMTVDGQTELGQTPRLDWRGATILMNTAGYVDPVRLPLGSRLIIDGDADAVAGVLADSTSRDPLEDVPLIDDHGYVMAEPGEYFLVFEATWGTDTVPFYFPIDLVPVQPDLRDRDAELAIDAYPFEAVLSYGGQRIAAPATSGSWTTDGEGFGIETAGHGLVPDWARIRVPAGTRLELSGNWEGWRNHLEPGDEKVTSNDDGSLAFPSSAGTYDWRMRASWPEGEAEFAFGVDLVDATNVENSSEPSSVDNLPTEEPGSETPSVLRVRCDSRGIEVLTPIVAAQADGLHVDAQIVDMADPEISLRSPRFPQIEYWSGSSGADDEFVRPVPVGKSVVHCESGPGQGNGPEPFEAPFEIVDPDRVFVDYSLDCHDEAIELSPPSELEDPPQDPIDIVSAHVSGLLEDDIIERAGYAAPADRRIVVRITRDGATIGWVYVDERPSDGWYPLTGFACVSSGLGSA